MGHFTMNLEMSKMSFKGLDDMPRCQKWESFGILP